MNCVGTLHAFEQVTRERRRSKDASARSPTTWGIGVKPGDLLLQIDPVDLNLSVRQAQSALDVEMAKLGLTDDDSPRSTSPIAQRR